MSEPTQTDCYVIRYRCGNCFREWDMRIAIGTKAYDIRTCPRCKQETACKVKPGITCQNCGCRVEVTTNAK